MFKFVVQVYLRSIKGHHSSVWEQLTGRATDHVGDWPDTWLEAGRDMYDCWSCTSCLLLQYFIHEQCRE